jgi:hypothetical protein
MTNVVTNVVRIVMLENLDARDTRSFLTDGIHFGGEAHLRLRLLAEIAGWKSD